MGNSIVSRGGVVVCLLSVLGLVACQPTTVAPGVEQTGKETRTTIAASPKQVAEAAAIVLQELELSDVRGMATRLDGKVTGMTSLGEIVEVQVVTAGTRTSQLTVSNDAGKGLAFEILKEIEARVYGQPSPNAGSGNGVVMFNPGEAVVDSSAEAAVEEAVDEVVETPAPAAVVDTSPARSGGIIPLDQLPPPIVEDPKDAALEAEEARDGHGSIKKR